MVRKLSLWVCPKVGCPKLSGKPGDCPVHHEAFIRRVYVEDNLTGTSGLGDFGDIFGKFYGKP